MAHHLLDNPAWNAMISANSHLALGNERVKFFPEEVGPFAGLKNYDEQSFSELYDLTPPERTVVIPTKKYLKIPAYWKLIETVKALQMIFNQPAACIGYFSGHCSIGDRTYSTDDGVNTTNPSRPFFRTYH